MFLKEAEVIGYCLVPDTRGKAFFVFQGVPDSGKSVLATFIRNCLNEDATVAWDINSLGEHFSASALVGKQLCLSMDVSSTPLSSKAIGDFKRLTGGDPITADVKYSPPITFVNSAKFILATNHPLLTQQAAPAFYRRAVVVPFCHTIPKEQQDFDLLDKLQRERDGIVNDALSAYWTLAANQYRFSGNFQFNKIFASMPHANLPSVDGALEAFLRSDCVFGEGQEAFVDDLYAAFSSRCGSKLDFQHSIQHKTAGNLSHPRIGHRTARAEEAS